MLIKMVGYFLKYSVGFCAVSLLSLSAWSYSMLSFENARFAKNRVFVHYDSQSCPTSPSLASVLSTAIEASWNTVGSSELRLELGSDQAGLSAVDGEIYVYCDANVSPGVLGVGGITHDGSRILFGNVRLNRTSYDGISLDQLVRVMIHELGHAIGIGHSEVFDAVMFGSLVSNSRELHSDDKAAVSFLYGTGAPVPPDPASSEEEESAGCASVDMGPTNGPNPMLNFVFMLLLSFLFYRFARLQAIRQTSRLK